MKTASVRVNLHDLMVRFSFARENTAVKFDKQRKQLITIDYSQKDNTTVKECTS